MAPRNVEQVAVALALRARLAVPATTALPAAVERRTVWRPSLRCEEAAAVATALAAAALAERVEGRFRSSLRGRSPSPTPASLPRQAKARRPRRATTSGAAVVEA